MKKVLIVLVVGALIYLGYWYVTNPFVSDSSDCESWLRAEENHRLDAVDEWVQDHPEAESSARWQKIYAKYVTTACEGRANDSGFAPDNVGDNLQDAVEALNR